MKTSAPVQFGLSSLLLVTVLAAVVMSVGTIAWACGFLLAIASAPALVRVYIIVRKTRGKGAPASARDKAALFLACFGISAVIVGATAGVFFVAALVGLLWSPPIVGMGGSNDLGITLGLILGLAAAAPLLIYMLVRWFTWPPEPIEVSPYWPAGQRRLRQISADANAGVNSSQENNEKKKPNCA